MWMCAIIGISITISWVYHIKQNGVCSECSSFFIRANIFFYISHYFDSLCDEQIKSVPNPNPTELFNSMMGVIWMFGIMFLYCEVGERVTHQFSVFHERLCFSDWFLFPLEMKRMFVIMLSNTHESIIIQGYANTDCTREAFKKVWFVDKSPWFFPLKKRCQT